MKTYINFLFVFAALTQTAFVFSQTKEDIIDLQQLTKSKSLDVFNRELSLLNESGHQGIKLNEKDSEGLVWLTGIDADGTIEFDVRGKDVQGRSFVSIAFHGLDNTGHSISSLMITFEEVTVFNTFPIRFLHGINCAKNFQINTNKLLILLQIQTIGCVFESSLTKIKLMHLLMDRANQA